MSDQAAVAGASLAGDQYYKIPVQIYGNGERLDSDLYFYHQQQYILFKSKDSVWSAVDQQKLESTQIENLFMKFKSHVEHNKFLQDKLSNLLNRRDVPLEKKAIMLYETAEPILASIFTSPNSVELITSAADYARSCIKYLNQKGSLPELVKLTAGSLSEHSHGLHVSAYSIALAKRAGIVEEQMIFGLGMGALLHDIGKSALPSDVINKPGELDDSEWQAMRQHPERGEKILDQRRQVVPIVAKQIVLEHHERVNGKGYPRGIKSQHTFSRIVAIADCFNTLTSDRPYAKALAPYDALAFMIQTMKHEFDVPLFEKFIGMLSKS